MKGKGLAALGGSDLAWFLGGRRAGESCSVSQGYPSQDPETRAALWGPQLQEDNDRAGWVPGWPQPHWLPLVHANLWALCQGLTNNFILLVIVMINKSRPDQCEKGLVSKIWQGNWQNTHQKYLSGLGFPVALQHRDTLCPALRAFVSGFITMYGVSGTGNKKW